MAGVLAKVFNTVFVGVQLAGLGIAIAGVAILQSECNKNDEAHNFPVNPFGLGPNLVRPMLSEAGNTSDGLSWLNSSYSTDFDCGMQYSWYWWVLALQLLCSIAGLLSTFVQSMRRGKVCVAAFYSTATALWCVFAYAMVWATYLYQAWSSDEMKHNNWAHGYECGAVGAIVTLAGNFVFLMIYGYDSSEAFEYREGHHHQKDVEIVHPPQPGGFHAA